jgi:hypothetical protein
MRHFGRFDGHADRRVVEHLTRSNLTELRVREIFPDFRGRCISGRYRLYHIVDRSPVRVCWCITVPFIAMRDRPLSSLRLLIVNAREDWFGTVHFFGHPH